MRTNNDSQGRKRQIFSTVAVLALMAGAAVFMTSAAFTATTSNPGDSIEAGTVSIGDSDAGTGKLYDALAQSPNAGPAARCIRVTYSGSLASAVKLYRGAVTAGDKFNLTRRAVGTASRRPASDMNCTGFATARTAFDNTLDQLPSTYAAGVDGKAAGAAWTSGQSVDYRFTVTVVDDSTPNAHTSAVDTGAHGYTWEARNN